MKKRIISLMLCILMCFSIALPLTSCGGNKGEKALVLMSDELDGLFNPFFSTTGADNTIVGMTQISMITTDYVNNEVVMAYGEDKAVVVKDLAIVYDEVTNETTYTFVIKNGIKFSDGHALTIEDVLFNMYVYLDPVYTGSSTMYSTDIKGLADYRSQTYGADSDVDETIADTARNLAKDRINELINLYREIGKTSSGYNATIEEMKAAISTHNVSAGYKNAISANPDSVTSADLLADYELTLKYFKEELNSDYVSAQEAFTEEPYKNYSQFQDEIFRFMFFEGFVSVEYELDPVTNKPDKNKFKTLTPMYANTITTKEAAIDYVYNSNVNSKLDQILKYWATAQKLETEYMAKAKEVILHKNVGDGELKVPNISGIQSLGHTSDKTTVTLVHDDNSETTYTIAKEHNEDGTPKNADEYDVLEIVINGVDPKAIWNFGFAVAPQHYYAEGHDVDIANNKFGVDYGSFDFMTKTIQSTRNIKIPMGAGPYKATNNDNSDTPDESNFFTNNVVYFKANNYFETVGEGINNPKIEKIRYQVIAASNALNALESGTVHYITPQLTNDNIDKLNNLKSKGIDYCYTDQLGYGYIGINAKKVPNIYIRKAIMSAMDTSLALSYYRSGTAETIYWPMSTVSWAYPEEDDGSKKKDNDHSYPAINFNKEDAKKAILEYMELAGVSEGDNELSIKFTIAGSNLTDHPTYNTFQAAADLLNECGWSIEVIADTQALTKLSTGSLSVWAAAWGSSIDPDMYQVYHKNSTATSVRAWGYDAILSDPATYSEENSILNDLSDLIDQARETNDREIRTALYEEAMKLILDLAVELPVYQRSTLYAYNTNVIDVSTIPDKNSLNPYSSPLDKIWEIDFAD